VVALGVSEDPDEVLECAEAGVAGYVSRRATVEDLVKTIEGVERGELCCSPRMAAEMFHRVAALAAGQAAARLFPLTVREQAIVQLISRGLSNKEIAHALSIEVATVKTHVHHILEKLGVPRRAAVAAWVGRDDHRARVFTSSDGVDPR
jgi:two-component system, NarL family, nitrate/nitrite response regulator NarL